jgi:hypothetical protein
MKGTSLRNVHRPPILMWHEEPARARWLFRDGKRQVPGTLNAIANWLDSKPR